MAKLLPDYEECVKHSSKIFGKFKVYEQSFFWFVVTIVPIKTFASVEKPEARLLRYLGQPFIALLLLRAIAKIDKQSRDEISGSILDEEIVLFLIGQIALVGKNMKKSNPRYYNSRAYKKAIRLVSVQVSNLALSVYKRLPDN